jgi:hypothetical protein
LPGYCVCPLLAVWGSGVRVPLAPQRYRRSFLKERGPVKTNLCVVLVRSASFLVLAGRVEVGVGVKAWAEPDRVAAVGP